MSWIGFALFFAKRPGFLSETSALAPQHLYSTCKRALFDVMNHLVERTETSFAWTRLFFLYGPHESRGRLVPAVIDALLAGEEARVTTGEQIRDYLHVRDARPAACRHDPRCRHRQRGRPRRSV